jgi:CheY-like chemotaxis protein
VIAEEGFDRDLSGESLLTEEEIRELLSDVPASREEGGNGDADASVNGGTRILFLSRRGADAALLRARLEARGAVLQVVRNPFTALDRMRVAPPEAIVTDLDLWADDGALLFDRLARLPSAVPVVFLARSRGDQARIDERLRKAGAWEVLFQPFDAGEAESAARRLLDAARGVPVARSSPPELEGIPPCSSGGPAGESSRPAEELGPSGELEGLDGLAERDVDARSSLLESGEGTGGESRLVARGGGPADGELGWLRFHLDLSRAVRTAGTREDRADAILECVLLRLAPRAAGLFFEVEGRAAARMESAPGAGQAALDSLCAVAETGRFARDVERSLQIRGAWGRLVMLDLPPATHAAASAYLDDVRNLVEAGIAR